MNYRILLSILFLSLVSPSVAMELNPQGLSTQESQEENQCPICFEEFNEATICTPCIHKFHKGCIEGWLKSGASACPICKTAINVNELAVVGYKNGSTIKQSNNVVQQTKKSRVRTILPPPGYHDQSPVRSSGLVQQFLADETRPQELKDLLLALQIRHEELEKGKQEALRNMGDVKLASQLQVEEIEAYESRNSDQIKADEELARAINLSLNS